MHSFTLDGAPIAARYIRSDYGPFQAKARDPALARLDDVSVKGGRRPILFAKLELTGVFCFTLYFLPSRHLNDEKTQTTTPH
jgi:hypothetical protein